MRWKYETPPCLPSPGSSWAFCFLARQTDKTKTKQSEVTAVLTRCLGLRKRKGREGQTVASLQFGGVSSGSESIVAGGQGHRLVGQDKSTMVVGADEICYTSSIVKTTLQNLDSILIHFQVVFTGQSTQRYTRGHRVWTLENQRRCRSKNPESPA